MVQQGKVYLPLIQPLGVGILYFETVIMRKCFLRQPNVILFNLFDLKLNLVYLIYLNVKLDF